MTYCGQRKNNINVKELILFVEVVNYLNMETKEGKKHNDIDLQIKLDFDFIMKDCPKFISSSWEMVGENYKQFSLYKVYYETRVTNSI